MKLTRQNSEWLIATVVAMLAITLAAFGVWVFHSPVAQDRSVADTILSDRITLGLVRMLIAATALYALASIAVLITRGRWLRSISTTGFEAEASRYSDRSLAQSEENLQRLLQDLDAAYRLFTRSEDG